MSESIAVDTNVVIAFLEQEASVVAHFAATETLVLPATVLGELYFGALKSTRATENLEKLDRLTRRVSVGLCDRGTASEYGRVRVELARRGRPIPDNDVWIAALARQHRLALATRDEHFAEVSGLRIERW